MGNETNDRVKSELVDLIEKDLDSMMHGAHVLYDVAKAIPAPYNALGGYASGWLHDFAGLAFRVKSYIRLNEGGAKDE